jgi:serine/threonine protein kinase/Tol biopolymer transport system component
MTLAAGDRLGVYEITGRLGAGAMGEVYRARDERLNRDVALKILPREFAAGALRMERFRLEAEAAGRLNHPNILAIYDFGVHDGVPFLVSELLDGSTLGELLREEGRIPARKAAGYIQQAANGLAAAHARGIVHRGIKPDNLFLTRDGVVKVLGFELPSSQPGESSRPDIAGAAAYMAPELIRHQPVDGRADIFSLGCVLYELLSGRLPFTGAVPVGVMRAILHDEPPGIAGLAPGLAEILNRCLDKNPDERFQSARDLAFALSAVAQAQPATGVLTQQVIVERVGHPSRLPALALAALAIMAALFAGYQIGTWTHPLPQYQFRRLTFRRGRIQAARFTPDHGVLYSAAWEDEPPAIFSVAVENPESHPAGIEDAALLAVSRTKEMAVMLKPHLSPGSSLPQGTLATVTQGFAPKQLMDRVEFADWSPDGKDLAVIRDTGDGAELQYPLGAVLAQTPGYFSDVRVSPDGKRVAMFEHPGGNDTAGQVVVVDRNGRKKTLSERFTDAAGLAWSARGDEVWFTAGRTGTRHDLWAVSLDSRERMVLRESASLVLEDISRNGEALLEGIDFRQRILFHSPGATRDRDLTWLDFGLASSISADGSRIAFSETGEGAGETQLAFIRPTDGGPAEKLGEGLLPVMSRDGDWAVAVDQVRRDIVMYPIGPGQPRRIVLDGFELERVGFLGDGKKLWLLGNHGEPGRRMFVMDANAGAEPEPVTPAGSVYAGVGATPDGRYVLAMVNGVIAGYPVSTRGSELKIEGIEPDDRLVAWGKEERSVLVYKRGELPAHVYRLDRLTGRRELVARIDPPDRAGLGQGISIVMTPDGQYYAYTIEQELGELRLAEGLR